MRGEGFGKDCPLPRVIIPHRVREGVRPEQLLPRPWARHIAVLALSLFGTRLSASCEWVHVKAWVREGFCWLQQKTITLKGKGGLGGRDAESQREEREEAHLHLPVKVDPLQIGVGNDVGPEWLRCK